MKNKVITLVLAAVLVLSSTSALAIESTGFTNFNFNDFFNYYNPSNLERETVAPETSTSEAYATEANTRENNRTNHIDTSNRNENTNTRLATNNVEPNANTTNTTSNVRASNSSYESQVVQLVNVERQKNGLQALSLDSAISNVARIKSKDMADNNYFAHNSPTYGSAGSMLKQYGINYTAWGENIASGQRSPEAVVNAWMNSQGHRENILSPNFTKIGVGYVTNSSGTPYWTQMFAR